MAEGTRAKAAAGDDDVNTRTAMRAGAGARELRGALAPALALALMLALALVGAGASHWKVGSVRTMRLVAQRCGRTICWGWSWLCWSWWPRSRADVVLVRDSGARQATKQAAMVPAAGVGGAGVSAL